LTFPVTRLTRTYAANNVSKQKQEDLARQELKAPVVVAEKSNCRISITTFDPSELLAKSLKIESKRNREAHDAQTNRAS
jgi:hypothetical protein